MTIVLRRLLLLLTLMFWQGGFMFYGAVVVPVGSEVLASDTGQGFITRSVCWPFSTLEWMASSMWRRCVCSTPPAFCMLHRWYLATSTAQWAVTVVLAGATIRVWRVADAE